MSHNFYSSNRAKSTFVVSTLKRIVAIAAPVLLTVLPARADAPTGRYASSAGTVLDKKTGLTWQQAAPLTGGDGAGNYTWSEAKSYCIGLTLNSVIWRLPTVNELITIVDHGASNPPRIDGTFFPGEPPDHFWSATLVSGLASDAWFVDFSDGTMFYLALAAKYRVRCVH